MIFLFNGCKYSRHWFTLRTRLLWQFYYYIFRLLYPDSWRSEFKKKITFHKILMKIYLFFILAIEMICNCKIHEHTDLINLLRLSQIFVIYTFFAYGCIQKWQSLTVLLDIQNPTRGSQSSNITLDIFFRFHRTCLILRLISLHSIRQSLYVFLVFVFSQSFFFFFCFAFRFVCLLGHFISFTQHTHFCFDT